jgi:hypothetical protein
MNQSIQGKRAGYNSRQSSESKEWVLYWKIKFNEVPLTKENHQLYKRLEKTLKTERFFIKR